MRKMHKKSTNVKLIERYEHNKIQKTYLLQETPKKNNNLEMLREFSVNPYTFKRHLQKLIRTEDLRKIAPLKEKI